MRKSEIIRQTAETSINLTLELDGTGKSDIATGCGFLDHMLTLFAAHGKFDLTVHCKGDTDVDIYPSFTPRRIYSYSISGALVGASVGASVGFVVGALVGASVGFVAGALVGASVGFVVGALVTSSVASSVGLSALSLSSSVCSEVIPSVRSSSAVVWATLEP